MPQQSLIDAAKAPVIAYGKKDWNAAAASVSQGILYDELATQRKTRGVDQLIACWKGWASAFPDSKATFKSHYESGGTVVLELAWRGTHSGALQTPGGSISPTGKTFEVPACFIVEIENGKAKSIRHYFDMMTLLQQLGVAKAA